jgi:hypothetical protein
MRAFIIIFLLGFSIRLFFLIKMPERTFLPNNRWEDTAIAMSLTEHGRFADPYIIPTGPTAHLPPLVPGIIAFFWTVFGMNQMGGYAIWIFSILGFSVLYALLPWIGSKLGLDRQAGVLGGIAGSMIVLPPGNGEEFAGLAIGLMAIAFLRRWTLGLGSTGGTLLLGAICGVLFHLQPVILPVVLGWMIFELWWSRDQRKWFLSGVMVLGMIIACVPWGWRNYKAFNEVIFVRGNLGLELRMSNHEGAAGATDVIVARGNFRHPRVHVDEARMIQELGEAKYMRQAKVEAIDWIIAHQGEFLKLTASRFAQFWLGPFHQPGTALSITVLTILAVLGVWFSLPVMTQTQRAALMTPLILYPLIYYVVMYMPRYRIPLDWILLLLAGAAIWRCLRVNPIFS